MQSIFRWPIESCVTSVKRSWSWTFFNSWSDIALEVAFWYLSVRCSWPQKMAMLMRQRSKKNAWVRVWIQLKIYCWSPKWGIVRRKWEQIFCIVGRVRAKFCTLFLPTMHHFEIDNIPHGCYRWWMLMLFYITAWCDVIIHSLGNQFHYWHISWTTWRCGNVELAWHQWHCLEHLQWHFGGCILQHWEPEYSYLVALFKITVGLCYEIGLKCFARDTPIAVQNIDYLQIFLGTLYHPSIYQLPFTNFAHIGCIF